MARNLSEKRPFPDLPDSVHRYYMEEAKWVVITKCADRRAMDAAYGAALDEGHEQLFDDLRLTDAPTIREFYEKTLKAGARHAS